MTEKLYKFSNAVISLLYFILCYIYEYNTYTRINTKNIKAIRPWINNIDIHLH